MEQIDHIRLRQAIREFLKAQYGTNLEGMSQEERQQNSREMQTFLAEVMRIVFNRPRIAFDFDSSKCTSQIIEEILKSAGPKRGVVAQHIVRAILELRFPGILIANESYSTADVQTERPGNFQVNGTVFHVTVNPALDVYDKCKRNLSNGLRPYLLVAENVLVAAQQQAKISAPGKITVSSIESFVAQNLDELSEFAPAENGLQMLRLLQIYNRRVDAAETDKSLLIEIPANLQGLIAPDHPVDSPSTP